MGLDIYAGTLSRYYARDWKTITQQYAEQMGYAYKTVNEQGQISSQEDRLSYNEVQPIVKEWQRCLLTELSAQCNEHQPAWSESEAQPYYTNKPDWDAFGALQLITACHLTKEPVPPVLTKGWYDGNHPSITCVSQDQAYAGWSLFRETILWIPINTCIVFTAALPNQRIATIASVKGLQTELEHINRLVWQADQDTIISWEQSEGYPIDISYPEQQIFRSGNEQHMLHSCRKQHMPHQSLTQTQGEYCTDSLAKYAFSILWQAASFCEQHQTIMILDY